MVLRFFRSVFTIRQPLLLLLDNHIVLAMCGCIRSTYSFPVYNATPWSPKSILSSHHHPHPLFNQLLLLPLLLPFSLSFSLASATYPSSPSHCNNDLQQCQIQFPTSSPTFPPTIPTSLCLISPRLSALSSPPTATPALSVSLPSLSLPVRLSFSRRHSSALCQTTGKRKGLLLSQILTFVYFFYRPLSF